MDSRLYSRRHGLALGAAAAASALLPLSEAVAQTAAAGGDWLAMIQQHHQLVAKSFDELLSKNDQPFEQRNLQLRTLNQLLHAHQLAEQNVIYPAMAMAGMQKEAEHLYMDEAHAKIINGQLMLGNQGQDRGGDWLNTARKLRDTVLKHAKDDEEGRLFPQLRQKLTPEQNRQVTQLYAREFSTVVPPR